MKESETKDNFEIWKTHLNKNAFYTRAETKGF
jgi:hypothetical protein